MKTLKKLCAVIVTVTFLLGCTPGYTIPQHKIDQHYRDRQECIEQNPRGGTFLIGPIIIILPLFIALVAASHAIQQSKIDACMVALGYDPKKETEVKNAQ
jgi:fumarate reductase subunit D